MRPKYYKICTAKIYNKKLRLESGRQSKMSQKVHKASGAGVQYGLAQRFNA